MKKLFNYTKNNNTNLKNLIENNTYYLKHQDITSLNFLTIILIIELI